MNPALAENLIGGRCFGKIKKEIMSLDDTNRVDDEQVDSDNSEDTLGANPSPDSAQEACSETESEVEQESSKKEKKKRKSKKEDKIAELEAQLADSKDKHLRLFSDFDNFRKRTMKERLDLLKSASADVIKNLLPVVDDLERALSSMADGNENKEGITLIYNKLIATLTKDGLEPMDAKGKVFDVDMHAALTRIPAPSEADKGTVVDVIEKGYLLNGKVLRYAKVVVGA